MEKYSRHVLVCTGTYCSEGRGGRATYAALAAALKREDLLFGSRRVKRSEAPCLGVCAGGPIVCVYPDGVWYQGVTPALMERIVVEHLKGGQTLDDNVFHRLQIGGDAAADDSDDD
ncbi:MAG TPA: (2Fe-2S) ferredoxin domain-containing protein [Gemmatimonas sp.]|nr:(2Fe-2S) ferredoxin domain-containing protein [Gemmatimonas sp.]